MAEEEDGSQEKSFDASESKIQKSREKGDTPQSQEANTLMLYMGLAIVLLLMANSVGYHMLSSLSTMLEYPEDIGAQFLLREGHAPLTKVSSLVTEPLLAIAPVFGILIAVLVISLILQQAITVAPEKLKPKLSRISPISNAKQKYGSQGLVEFGKRFFKLCFITVVAGFFFASLLKTLPGMSAIAAANILPEMREMSLTLTFYMIGAMTMITLFDLPYSRFAHLKKLRMTLKEVKDEAKDSEGDPHMKSERRNRALSLSQSTMLQDIVGADVVIVNPTHYAVALKWDREQKGVPLCVAKGVDEMALRIRQRAQLYNVAIYSDPPCARSLFASVEIGDAIKPEHYAAVAASIHFADRLKPKEY